MKRRTKIFLKLSLFILSIIIAMFLIMVNLIILFKYTGKYEITNNINNEFVREELKKINVEISEEAKISKINYERLWDICNYEITYEENGTEKTIAAADTKRSELEQYIINCGKNYNKYIYLVVFLIAVFQIGFPTYCLALLIKEIKKKDKIEKEKI